MLVVSILVCAVGGLGFYIWSAYKSAGAFWEKRGFDTTGSDTATMLTGSLLQHELDQNIYKQAKARNKRLLGTMEFWKPILYMTDLDLARQIFIKDFDTFTNRREMEMFAKSKDAMVSKMLVFMEDEPWKEMRAKMSPTFTTGKIRRMFEILNASSMELVKYLQNQASSQEDHVVNLQDAYERYTIGSIASSAFGVDAKAFQQEQSIFQKMGRRMLIELNPLIIMKFIFMSAAPRLATAVGLGMFEKEPEQFFSNVIKSAIQHRQKSGETRDDFLQLMLEARSGQLKAVEESELSAFEKEAKVTVTAKGTKGLGLTEFTDDVIVAQSLLFILAGFETTQSLLLFAVYELALNPEIQEQLAREVEEALENNGGKFTYEIVNQLEYLDKVVNESLRKYPPAARLERRSGADYKVPDTELVIPKDTLIAIPTYAIHHDEEHFPDPERFDPERFSKEVKSTRHPYAFQPFGHGPRNCIGMRFALTSAKIALANIVNNFVLEPCSKTLTPLKFTKLTTLRPESVFLKLKPRK